MQGQIFLIFKFYFVCIFGIFGCILGIYWVYIWVCMCVGARGGQNILLGHSLKVVDFLCDRVSHGLELFK